MPHRSAVELLTILQAHGLSDAILELMVRHCELTMTGHMQLHTVDGRILAYDLRAMGKVAALSHDFICAGTVVQDPSRGPGMGTVLRVHRT